jgi:hypothetical protein
VARDVPKLCEDLEPDTAAHPGGGVDRVQIV